MIEYKAYYGVNCLDKEIGLPYLLKLVRQKKIKKFDLCLTDPFYNINAGITKGLKYKGRRKDNVKVYEDVMNPEMYKIFSNIWFYYVKRICKQIVFTCGIENKKMWYNIADFGEITWVIPNSSSRGKYSQFIKSEPILCYGNFKQKKFLFSCIEAYVDSGFLVAKDTRYQKITHPHPKPKRLYQQIIDQLKPKSILDIFLGSGTTAEVSAENSIKFLGYELKQEYEQDYINRMKYIRIRPKDNKEQSYLDKFLGIELEEKKPINRKKVVIPNPKDNKQQSLLEKYFYEE